MKNRIIDKPKAINRKKLVAFVLSIHPEKVRFTFWKMGGVKINAQISSCSLVEFYYVGGSAAPWLLFSGQGAKSQGRRQPLVLPLTLCELTATYPAIRSCSMASRCFMFIYFLLSHWVPATCHSRAQTSIKAELPSGKAPTTLVLRRISRFIRSITLLVRIFVQCSEGKSQ